MNEQGNMDWGAACQVAADAIRAFTAALWEPYRQAGMPYGETEVGLNRWFHGASRRRYEHRLPSVTVHGE